MDLPFTTEQFIELFRRYNNAIFPFHLLFYILAILLVYLVTRPRRRHNNIINLALAFFWLWMAIGYHLLFFTPVNPAAWGFAAIFILQAAGFIYYGPYRRRLTYRFQTNAAGICGAILVVFALLVYPLIGYFSGHVFPAAPVFGLPCPTTIFTFGLLLWSDRPPRRMLVIPFIWSGIGFSAALQLGMTEDLALPAVAILATVLVLLRNQPKPARRHTGET